MPNIYHSLSKVKFLSKRYTAKFLFIAFLGIHVPLICLVIFIATGAIHLSAGNVILLTLAATLVATAVTLLMLNNLLWPLHQTKKNLNEYLVNKQLPSLPLTYQDEAGILMKDVQDTIESIESLLEEKKDIIALFSHDIRTPFSQFIHLSQLIKLENDAQKLHFFCDTIEDISRQQLQLCEDLLYHLKTDITEVKKHLNDRLSVSLLLNSVVKTHQQQAADKNITLSLAVSPDLFVTGDRTLLTEAISNIVSNAIKFSHEDSVISISATQHAGICTMEIRDKGIGFDEKILPTMFDRFTAAGRSGTKGEKSTGLGLHLTRKIIQKHNGQIEAASKGFNEGSVFTVKLPLTK